MNRRSIAVVSGFAALALTTGCLPYSLANTAQTVPEGEHKTTTTYWFMPNGVGFRDDSLTPRHTLRGIDAEVRWGIDEDSDFGLRVPTGSGIVATYKRRVAGYPHPDSAAVAWQLGGGFVNWGDHAMGEFSLLASGPKRGGAVWYGGARIMHVEPLSEGAVHDDPSTGGLIGARITIGGEEIIPELAVYHDPSALRIRQSNYIFVPSLSVKGTSLLRGLGGLGRYVAAGALRPH
jgi:hypothetical protein